MSIQPADLNRFRTKLNPIPPREPGNQSVECEEGSDGAPQAREGPPVEGLRVGNAPKQPPPKEKIAGREAEG